MATRTIRGNVAAALKTVISAAITPVRFTLSYPNDPNPEQMFLGETQGEMSPLHMSGPTRAHRKDDWGITVYLEAKKAGQTDVEAYQRTATIFGLAEDAIAGNQNLSTLDGLLVLKVTRVNGPNVAPTKEGYFGFLSFEVACTATLT